MISFWVNAAGSFGMEEYLAGRAKSLADRIQVRRYEALSPRLEVDTGAHIFSSLDQLTDGGRDAVAALYDQLSALSPAGKLLNDPRRVPRRSQLLQQMFDSGINRFRAYPASLAIEPERFPVFLREDTGHDGALTGLLASRRELRRGLMALLARGFRQANLLVVEFCDLVGPDELYRTGSAFKVGEQIVPAQLMSGPDWMLKWDGSDHDERAMREHLDFVLTNPHQAWIREIFDRAGIDYGRIDYGVQGELLQVWEINTNPSLAPSAGPVLGPPLHAMLEQARDAHHTALQTAFRALEPVATNATVTVRLDPALIARMQAESRHARRREGVVGFFKTIYRWPYIGGLFRAVFARLFPRR